MTSCCIWPIPRQSGSTDRDGAVMIGNVAMPPDATIDLRQENLFVRIRRALRAIVLRENRLILVSDDSPYRPQSDD